MDFDTTLLLSELSPPKHVQAQVYGCGVKGIDVTTEFENVGSTLALSFINKKVRVLLKNAIVTLLVRLYQSCF